MPELDLSPDTVVQLAPGLRTRQDSTGHVLVDAPVGTIIDIGPEGYGLLALFSRPTSLGEAIARLEADRGRTTTFAPAMGVINMLLEESALVVVGAGRAPMSGWADPVEHARMLHDHRRTGDFVAAIRAAVRPDDVVLDIGTGSGVLAVAAARAGARHVYAVEASDIAEVAARVFEANGVADRITLIRGWSRQVDLPEPATLLVAEVIGNEPFEEEILETTLDARRRLLAPGARLIPRSLTVLVRPVLLPEAELRQRAFGRAAVDRWHRLYGIDFAPLLDAAPSGPVHTLTEGEVVATWESRGPASELLSVDLGSFDRPSLSASTDLVVDSPGAVNAVAMTFVATLDDETVHTFDPWRWPASSWATSVWVLGDAVELPSGGALRVGYRRRVEGSPDGLTCRPVDAPAP